MKLNFSEEQYSSDYGMITYTWGPLLWHVLHIISFNYPVNPIEYNIKNGLMPGFIENAYYHIILLLQYVLPCKSCRDNLKINLNNLDFFKPEKKNIIMRNRKTFSKFIYNLHEIINKMLHKESGLSYEEVRDFYEHFRANCSKKKNEKTHLGCDKLQHNSEERVKPKTVIYFVPFSKNIKTTKIHKKCKIRCIHNN